MHRNRPLLPMSNIAPLTQQEPASVVLGRSRQRTCEVPFTLARSTCNRSPTARTRTHPRLKASLVHTLNPHIKRCVRFITPHQRNHVQFSQRNKFMRVNWLVRVRQDHICPEHRPLSRISCCSCYLSHKLRKHSNPPSPLNFALAASICDVIHLITTNVEQFALHASRLLRYQVTHQRKRRRFRRT